MVRVQLTRYETNKHIFLVVDEFWQSHRCGLMFESKSFQQLKRFRDPIFEFDCLDNVTIRYSAAKFNDLKYSSYIEAIRAAILDMTDLSTKGKVKSLKLMVVSKKKVPLFNATVNALWFMDSKLFDKFDKITVYTIELYSKEAERLRNIIDCRWNNQQEFRNAIKMKVSSEESNVKKLEGTIDIIVSDLRGNCAFTECCMHSVSVIRSFLKPKGVTIPKGITYFVRPVMASSTERKINRMHKKARENPSFEYFPAFDVRWTGELKRCYFIDDAKEVFSLLYEDDGDARNKSETKTVSFIPRIDCVLSAFIFFFKAVLYKDIRLSNLESSLWCPRFMIIEKDEYPRINITKNESFDFEISRQCDNR